ncbi:MAG: hypothetical protein ACI883_001671 [Candidatus Azotimanducaceae bacterium]|jgi:hypothetical protein|tara:strand:- start:33 stop:1553 length:1521 start_codon:yes stop_codon:yes gene_type:complete
MWNFDRTKSTDEIYRSGTDQGHRRPSIAGVSAQARGFISGILALATLLSAPLNLQAALASQQSQTQDVYQFLQTQISQDEINEAKLALKQIILDIEASSGRYAPELIQPLSILGKAQMASADYMPAVETFDRAIHLTRTNFGLFDANQTALVYLQADAYIAMNDLRNAQQREEYAFQVLSKRASRKNLLIGMLRLGEFHLVTYNFLAARTLFRQGYEVLQANGFSDSDSAIPFLKGTANSYQMERFPPLYFQERRVQELGQKPTNTQNLDYGYEYLSINDFPAGERALQKAVKIRQSALIFRDDNPNSEVLQYNQGLVNQALLDLGDWHLLFGNQKKAHTLYREIHQQQLKFPKELKIGLDRPHLLYFPKPQKLKPPPLQDRLDMATGSITLEFSVEKNGRIRGLNTVAFEPNDAMEFHTRRSMRQAIYRPALFDGQAQVTPKHTYIHTYQYFPSLKERQKELRKLERQEPQAVLPGKQVNNLKENNNNAVNAISGTVESTPEGNL